MARLFTSGFELGSALPTAEGFTQDTHTGTATNDATTFRSGARAQKLAPTTTQQEAWYFSFTSVLTRTYYLRCAVNFPSLPASGSSFNAILRNSTDNGVTISVANTGVVTLQNENAGGVLITGPTLTTNTWYVLECSYNATSKACELKVDGTSYGTATGTDTATTAFRAYMFAFHAQTVFIDDFAVNDDQGSANNSWCGNNGKVILLKPASDSATTGFTEGAGGTGSLFAATDNIPPTGVVLASATNTSQIKDATSNTTDNYQPTLQTYTVGGVGGGDTINLVQAIAVHGNSTTTSRNNGIQSVSNPTIAETTGATGTTAAGTYPTGWTLLKTVVADSPSVTLGTGPVLEFRKATASTDSAMASLLGLLVEYTPSTGLAVNVSDSAATSETVAVTPLALVLSVSDSATTSESVTVQLVTAGTLAINVSDSASVSETVAAQVSASQINVSDSAHATETVTVSPPSSSPQISVSDSTSTSEWIVIAFDPDIIFTLEVNVEDDVTTDDSTVSLRCPSPLSVTDSATTAETTSASISSPQVNVSDSTHATETTSATMANLQIAVTDSTHATESTTVVLPLAGSLTVVVQDSAHATETTNATVSTSQIAVSDSTSTTESRGVFVNASGNPPNTHPPLGGTFDNTTSGGTFNGGASGGNITTTNRGGNVTFTGPGGTPNTGSSGGTIKKPTRGGIVQLPAAGGDIE